jgi:hypothetical protein
MVEICAQCQGHLWHPETRSFEEPHSPTGRYTELGERFIFVGQTQEPLRFYQRQVPRVVRIRMITTRPDYGDEDYIIMKSTDGEGIPLQIGENPNSLEHGTFPLEWNNRDGPQPDYTAQD